MFSKDSFNFAYDEFKQWSLIFMSSLLSFPPQKDKNKQELISITQQRPYNLSQIFTFFLSSLSNDDNLYH